MTFKGFIYNFEKGCLCCTIEGKYWANRQSLGKV